MLNPCNIEDVITGIQIQNFKKFDNADFEISQPVSLFVGQNNGGKTTALQAITLWSFLISLWRIRKGGGTAKQRVGASITRAEIHPTPILEIADLWTGRRVRKEGTTSENVKIQITLRGVNNRTAEPWEYGVEATFANRELLYANPIDVEKEIPEEVGRIFHLPPLSGVQTEEPKVDPGAQLRAIGEGRPGEILRNLLLGLSDANPAGWSKLTAAAREFFSVEILPIQYNSAVDPHISVYYRPVVSASKKQYEMEISNAGSGFLQFLLIAAFLLAHENAILLIDEPDSHMHVFLQRAIFEWLQKVAIEEKAQVIISTHSEVLINVSGLENLVTFFGSHPKPIKAKSSQLISALSEVSPLAIISAEWKKKIIYVEGETDRKLLIAWAEALEHPVSKILPETFFHSCGTNDSNAAKQHFSALCSVTDSSLRGFFLRDSVLKKDEGLPEGLLGRYWSQPEIENYLLHPAALIRFVENCGLGGLFALPKKEKAEKYLTAHLTPAYVMDPHGNFSDLGKKKGSDFLEDFLKQLDIPSGKSDYWRIAQTMRPEEVFPEVKKVLDDLNTFLS